MNPRRIAHSSKFCLVCWLLLLAAGPKFVSAQPSPGAEAAFNRYVETVEARLVEQHRASSGIVLSPELGASLRHGEVAIERLSQTEQELPGALLHHWRGTAFAAGATAAEVEGLLRDFGAYPQRYAPEVVQAKVLTAQDDRMTAWMRVRQHHVLTVVMDTTYDVTFGRLDARTGVERVAEYAGCGDCSAGNDEGTCAGAGRRARLSVADEYLLELGGAGRRGLSAGGIGVIEPGDPDGAGVGGEAVCGEYSAGVA